MAPRRYGSGETPQVTLVSSVAVKWYSKETKSIEALAILDSFVQGSVELTVSDILFCEVGNALRYKPDYHAEN